MAGTLVGTSLETCALAPTVFVAISARTPPMPRVALFVYAGPLALRSSAAVSETGTTKGFVGGRKGEAYEGAAQGLVRASSIAVATPKDAPPLRQGVAGTASLGGSRTTGTQAGRTASGRPVAASAAKVTMLRPTAARKAGLGASALS